MCESQLYFYLLFYTQHHAESLLMTLFHQNYCFNMLDKHQTIDLVKKICWKLLSFHELVRGCIIVRPSEKEMN
jgi:hypothetical protein